MNVRVKIELMKWLREPWDSACGMLVLLELLIFWRMHNFFGCFVSFLHTASNSQDNFLCQSTRLSFQSTRLLSVAQVLPRRHMRILPVLGTLLIMMVCLSLCCRITLARRADASANSSSSLGGSEMRSASGKLRKVDRQRFHTDVTIILSDIVMRS